MRAVIFAALWLLHVTAVADDDLDDLFTRDVLVVIANKHACHRFDVHLAVTNEQHRRGLMFVRAMPDMSGMLFIYPSEGRLSMWMKNTLIPLDIVFAKSDGTVSSVVRNTEPQSLKSLAAIEPVSFVLELNAGITERFSIDAGSRLFWIPAQE